MTNPRFSFLSWAVAAGALASIAPANAAVITGVGIESVSSQLGEFSFQGAFERGAIHIVDGSGFDELTGTHTNIPDSGGGAGPAPAAMWLSNGVFGTPNNPLPAFVVFDLGGNYDLDSLKVWNYNEAFASPTLVQRGANSVDISVASAPGGPFTALGNFNFTIAPGTTDVDFGQVIDLSSFTAANNAQLVRFDILTNHGGDNSFAGLSEVRFSGAVVPEPASAGFIALALAGLVLRRRR